MRRTHPLPQAAERAALAGAGEGGEGVREGRLPLRQEAPAQHPWLESYPQLRLVFGPCVVVIFFGF